MTGAPRSKFIVNPFAPAEPASRAGPVCRLLRLPRVRHPSGSLVWGQAGTHLPFQPVRFWCIRDVPPGHVRGNHAHRSLHEILVCLQGACVVSVDDGAQIEIVALDAPDVALHVPPLVWSIQREFSPDAALLVLADQVYRDDDYVRDYDEFRALVAPER